MMRLKREVHYKKATAGWCINSFRAWSQLVCWSRASPKIRIYRRYLPAAWFSSTHRGILLVPGPPVISNNIRPGTLQSTIHNSSWSGRNLDSPSFVAYSVCSRRFYYIDCLFSEKVTNYSRMSCRLVRVQSEDDGQLEFCFSFTEAQIRPRPTPSSSRLSNPLRASRT